MATTWVFERADECLRVQRQDVLGELRIVIWGSGMTDRIQVFEDEVQLVACMTALDHHLVAAGWSLVDFFPERRSSARTGAGCADHRPDGRLPRYTDASHDAARQASLDDVRP